MNKNILLGGRILLLTAFIINLLYIWYDRGSYLKFLAVGLSPDGQIAAQKAILTNADRYTAMFYSNHQNIYLIRAYSHKNG